MMDDVSLFLFYLSLLPWHCGVLSYKWVCPKVCQSSSRHSSPCGHIPVSNNTHSNISNVFHSCIYLITCITKWSHKCLPLVIYIFLAHMLSDKLLESVNVPLKNCLFKLQLSYNLNDDKILALFNLELKTNVWSFSIYRAVKINKVNGYCGFKTSICQKVILL